jgi:hypothetical protein
MHGIGAHPWENVQQSSRHCAGYSTAPSTLPAGLSDSHSVAAHSGNHPTPHPPLWAQISLSAANTGVAPVTATLKDTKQGGRSADLKATTFAANAPQAMPADPAGSPFTGEYLPAEPLSAFPASGSGVGAGAGGSLGMWTLRLVDLGEAADRCGPAGAGGWLSGDGGSEWVKPTQSDCCSVHNIGSCQTVPCQLAVACQHCASSSAAALKVPSQLKCRLCSSPMHGKWHLPLHQQVPDLQVLVLVRAVSYPCPFSRHLCVSSVSMSCSKKIHYHQCTGGGLRKGGYV